MDIQNEFKSIQKICDSIVRQMIIKENVGIVPQGFYTYNEGDYFLLAEGSTKEDYFAIKNKVEQNVRSLIEEESKLFIFTKGTVIKTENDHYQVYIKLVEKGD